VNDHTSSTRAFLMIKQLSWTYGSRHFKKRFETRRRWTTTQFMIIGQNSISGPGAIVAPITYIASFHGILGKSNLLSKREGMMHEFLKAIVSKRGSRHRRPMPTDEELEIWQQIRKDLQDYLYAGLAGRFQIAGHRHIGRWARSYAKSNNVVLEIACGQGHHLRYGGNRYSNYIGMDIQDVYLHTLRRLFLGTAAVQGTAYALPFRDTSVDCILSIYCFEHFRHLPICLEEIRRVLKSDGELLVGLPAEGGFLYQVGRWLTSKRHMQRKYGIDYGAIVRWEHWNTFKEVIQTVKEQFHILELKFIPFPFFPTVHCNTIGCFRARPI
jgi:phosphatidylethanolamine/phosphatidyl-N-methylethanolamine N-methyltransferase